MLLFWRLYFRSESCQVSRSHAMWAVPKHNWCLCMNIYLHFLLHFAFWQALHTFFEDLPDKGPLFYSSPCSEPNSGSVGAFGSPLSWAFLLRDHLCLDWSPSELWERALPAAEWWPQTSSWGDVPEHLSGLWGCFQQLVHFFSFEWSSGEGMDGTRILTYISHSCSRPWCKLVSQAAFPSSF